MQKIKTEQPYKLYRKIFRDSSNAKIIIIVLILLLLFAIVMTIIDPNLQKLWRMGALFIILLIYLPLQLYDFKLKAEYEPGLSYKHFRDYKKFQSKLLFFRDEDELMRMENHQDIDYNVKVDLNAIYGVNDKLEISYQNFKYEEKKMKDGDYLLGVSAQGVYYVRKDKKITKKKINFEDIDTIGLLAGIGGVLVFHIISKQKDEISIIIKQFDSSLVSPYMLFSTLLKSLDNYILNGGAFSHTSSKRRRVSVSSGTNTITDPTQKETQKRQSKRVIDITYSAGVLKEMAAATYVGSNRVLEVDTPISTRIEEETPFTQRTTESTNGFNSNRSIDLED